MKQHLPKSIYSLLLVSTIISTGCDSDSSLTTPTVTLQWAPCEENSRVECTELEVPMDHANPDGEKITIALNRISSESESKQGSLLFNPGGPGSSGTGLILSFEEDGLVPDAVRNAYDLIGFDPRGVNKSTPVDCKEFINEDENEYPLDLTDLQSYQTSNANFVEKCVHKYGGYLQHLGSAAVVDDMELIRKALDEPTLNFVGYSYGTRLAGLYAQTNPTTTGRMVLDASVSPDNGVIELFEGQLVPHENNLQLFANLCQSHSDCNPVNYKQQIIDHSNDLIANENEQALEIVVLVLLLVIQNVDLAPEYSEPFYDYMQNGDISTLAEAISFLFEDSENLEDSEDSGFNEKAAQRSVLCADDAFRPTVEEVEALRVRFNNQSDLIAEPQLIGAANCMDWPVALRPVPPIASDTAPELLVVAGPVDTLTPAVWGERMAQAIGARYLLSDHTGHTVVFQERNSCTERVVLEYLVDGILPDEMFCPASE